MKLEIIEHCITAGNWGFLAFDPEHPLEPKTQAFGYSWAEAVKNLEAKLKQNQVFDVGDKVKIKPKHHQAGYKGTIKRIGTYTVNGSTFHQADWCEVESDLNENHCMSPKTMTVRAHNLELTI